MSLALLVWGAIAFGIPGAVFIGMYVYHLWMGMEEDQALLNSFEWAVEAFLETISWGLELFWTI